MPDQFVPGLELSRRLYLDGVAPLLAANYPTLRYAAALIGAGSQVLGFDTVRSTDHDWGPRLQLFLKLEDCERLGPELATLFSERLPQSILGYSTHLITAELGSWFVAQLGFDPNNAIETLDWLATPTQLLASVTAGAVFHDGLGEITRARERLAWYPVDVWRYVLACQWQRIAEEEPFVGRAAEIGDELGSAVLAARLVRDVMRLQLLQHRRYPPYNKWLGSAFARVPDAPLSSALLAVSARGPAEREDALAAVYEHAARTQNQLGLAPYVDPTTRPFHDRPFRVLHAERFAEALNNSIEDPLIRALPLVGAIDQWVDNTTAVGGLPALRRAQQKMLDGAQPPTGRD